MKTKNKFEYFSVFLRIVNIYLRQSVEASRVIHYNFLNLVKAGWIYLRMKRCLQP